MNTANKLFSTVAVGFICLSLPGCGSDSGAPSNGSITIAPAAKTWDAIAASPVVQVGDVFTITIMDDKGNPLPGVDFSVTLDLSCNTIFPAPVSGLYPMELYDDLNGNDTFFEAGEGPLCPVAFYNFKTGAFGSKQLGILRRVGGGYAYKGSLTVYSGKLVEGADLEVTCSDC